MAAQESPTSHAVKEQHLLEPYARFRGEPLSALQELASHVVGEGWRSYDTIIGQEIFYSGFSEKMKGMVIRQDSLKKQIAFLAKRRVEVELHDGGLGPLGVEGEDAGHKSRREARRAEIEEQLRQVAENWTDKMICKMESRYFIRGAYYFATQLLTRAYHQGIYVTTEEVTHLRKVAEEAAAKKQSIIFLPCHRSHVDYVSLQLICYKLGLALPTVVAGDNLNFPLVGSFLQHAGAMWIRRSFGDDQLYPTLVQAYMDTLLQNGYNVECFIEGGRSRTGKLLPPKFGILSFFLDSLLSGKVEDAMVCPVSTQYDKVVEVDSYVSELLGQPKPKEGLMSFLSASNVLSLKLGRVDVRFQKPWSLREFINEHTSRFQKESQSSDIAQGQTLRRRLLQTLGYKVLADINAVSAIMPTALVGTVLLTLRGRGVGRSELVRRVDWLSDGIRRQGGQVGHFAGKSTEVVVYHALEVLGPELVGTVEGLAEKTYYAEDRFQLSFYRNMTIHLFIAQALTCAALYTKIKQGGEAARQSMSYDELKSYVYFLSQLFRAEFIFPTAPLEQNLSATIEGLERDHVLQTSTDNSISLHPDELALGRDNFDFYNFLIWPFIEAAWLSAISLFMLTPQQHHNDSISWYDFRTVQNKAQFLGKTLYHQGDLSYYEAVNKEALNQSFGRSEEAGIIVVSRSKDAKIPARVRLAAEWMPIRNEDGKVKAEGPLWDLCERISQSRREGKNRRDGATVRTRVLNLVDVVSKDLVETVVSGEHRTPTASARRRGIQTTSHL